MKKILLILVACFCGQFAFGQGWEKFYTFNSSASSAVAATETSDGNIIFTVRTNTTFNGASLVIVKIDKQGNTIWSYSPPNLTITADSSSIIRTNDNAYLIFCNDRNSPSIPRTCVLKIDNNGQELWRKTYLLSGFTRAERIENTNEIVFFGLQFYLNPTGGYLMRINMNGDSLWAKKGLDIRGYGLGIGRNKSNFITGRDMAFTSKVWRLDSLGNEVWSKPISAFTAALKVSKDGGAYVNGGIKFDENGNKLWEDSWTSNWGVTECFDGKLAFIGRNSAFPNSTFFVQRYPNGSIYSQKIFEVGSNGFFNQTIQLSDSSFISVGNYQQRARVIRFNSNGVLYSNFFNGKIFKDSITNCQIDQSEIGIKNWLVVADKGDNNPKYGLSNASGNYSILLDTGNYVVKTYQPNQNWQLCTPSVSKSILVKERTDIINFAAQAAFNCPQMRLSLSTFGLRRCFENTYQINYLNEGTTAATNSYLTLKLDSLLEYVSATRPLSSQQGQLLRFNLGNIGVGDDGNFAVNVRVRCGDSTRLGQTLCTEARIYPDTFCVPTQNWSGANIVVNGRCDRDSVRFEVRNIGTAQSGDLQRIITEDEIVFLRNRTIYPPNSTRTLSFPANGKTWRLMTEQEPNHPLSNRPTAVVEGCRSLPNLPISLGFVNQFPTDDGSPTVDNLCNPIVGSYDPNDKQGLPFGYKVSHFIEQNQDLEYTVRFQNTGTDTAFTVVIRDTLSDLLDLPSVRTGASSHRFTWTIEDKNVLVFRFDDIRLPDSFRNVAASQGFVKFKIKQKKDLALGSVIRNSAAIFFDFNAPIITNQTFHTIGKDFITVSIDEPRQPNLAKIKVYPNPFAESAVIEIEEKDPLSKTLIFNLLDATGRLVRQEKFIGNTFQFDRRDLPNGFYVFKIESDNKLIGSGKMVIK